MGIGLSEVGCFRSLPCVAGPRSDIHENESLGSSAQPLTVFPIVFGGWYPAASRQNDAGDSRSKFSRNPSNVRNDTNICQNRWIGHNALSFGFDLYRRRQRPTNRPPSSVITTNWVGYLVAGQGDTMDRITPHPSPTIVRQVEIGLRSDGIVVWRAASKAK